MLDDNPIIRRILRTMLERDYVVDDFDDGAVLLEYLEENPCDLIVSDLCLPHMNGFDFIAELKKNARLRRIPVMAYSACESKETCRRALAAGFTAFLEKPAPMAQLLSLIAESLSPPACL